MLAFHRHLHAILHRPTQFHPNRTTPLELWRHMNFSRQRPWRRKSTSGFGFSDITHFRKFKSICWQNFCEISQSMADFITTSSLWKQPAAMEILLPVRNRHMCRFEMIPFPPSFLNTSRPKLLAFTKNPTWQRPPSWIVFRRYHYQATQSLRKCPENFVLISWLLIEICRFCTWNFMHWRSLFPPNLWRFFGRFGPRNIVRYCRDLKRHIFGWRHAFWYIPGGPKMAVFLYALTLSNINRFSKLFHYQNQKKTCNNTITKDPTTPQVCRYTTLWNVKCLQSNNWKQGDSCNNTF